MEVEMFHPDNKKAKVKVTNAQQEAGFRKMGFVDAPVKESKDLEAASTDPLVAKPDADSSKEAPKSGEADTTSDVDKKNEAAKGSDQKLASHKTEKGTK